MTGDWCVLRMSGPSTLPVAAALVEAGFDAWTPAEAKTVCVGPKRKEVERRFPLLPSFVFARYDRIHDLAAFVRSPQRVFNVWDREQRRMVSKGCPYFTLMRHGGQYVAVSDRSLDALRTSERLWQPLRELKTFKPGEVVRCPAAGFDGLVGTIEETRRRIAVVSFPGMRNLAFISMDHLFPAS